MTVNECPLKFFHYVTKWHSIAVSLQPKIQKKQEQYERNG